MAYDKIREKAETLFRDDPYKSSKEIVEDLLELCPEQRMPHPRTVDNWRNEDRLPRKASPSVKGPAQTSNQRVVDDTVRKEGEDYLGEPWTTLLWRYPAEFAAAVAAYQGEMEFATQVKEVANGNRATFTRQTTRYGPGQRPFVEAIFNRDSKLRVLRGSHRAALDSGEAVTARSIGIQIGELLDGWVSE